MLGDVTEALGRIAEKKKLQIYQDGQKLDSVEFFSDDVALPVLFAHAMNKARTMGIDTAALLNWPVDLHVSSVGFFNVIAEADEAVMTSVDAIEMCLYAWDSFEEILHLIAEAGKISKTPDGFYIVETPFFYQAARVLNGENFNVTSWHNKKAGIMPKASDQANTPFFL